MVVAVQSITEQIQLFIARVRRNCRPSGGPQTLSKPFQIPSTKIPASACKVTRPNSAAPGRRQPARRHVDETVQNLGGRTKPVDRVVPNFPALASRRPIYLPGYRPTDPPGS